MTTCCARTDALSRRGFLRGLGGAAALVAAAPLVDVRAAYADGYGGDVLVVVSLRGGMDGLSLVAPVGDPDYAHLRPTLAVPATLGPGTGDRMFALHPALAPLRPWWEAGTFGAVHAVGSPDGSRSHFRSSEELDRAAPGTSVRTGWLDRVLGAHGSGRVFQGVQLGSSTAGGLMAGPAPTLAAQRLDTLTLSQAEWVGPRLSRTLAALYRDDDGPAGAAGRQTLDVVDRAAAIAKGDVTPRGGASYPQTRLGRALADVARLVRAGDGLQAASVDLGDWDMHADLGRAGGGWMAGQVGELAGCLAAFATDLGPDFGRVTVVTLSEFGRRAAENGSGGVDHGFGNAVLLLGGGVVGGAVHGHWPGLSEQALDHGDLAGTTDFRSVLAELLVRRCGLSPSALSGVFPDFRPEFLGLCRPG